MISSGISQTSKGKEKFNHLSAFNPINIPKAMLARNCIPIPAYFNKSLLVSFLVFKTYLLINPAIKFSISFKVVKNKALLLYNHIFDQNNRIFKIILQKTSSYQ